jgi:hypothetical protein
MAQASSSAAEATNYELRELAEGAVLLDLGVRYSGPRFADVVESALEFLAANDPDREGRVAALQIVRVDGAGRTVVWRYRYGATPAVDPIHVWGFDVTRAWGRAV